ncbi:quinone-dependent dihydroorotate dehydrogenase [Sphingomonas sp.]|uniref:quinone-dependent dihydroorotate dehydrogenase n=1 Tax=Sphingomonas sp. TaxID=28214 RepID=UPI003CC557DB
MTFPLRRALWLLDAERAHRLTVAALRLMPLRAPPAADPILSTEIAGLRFPTPVGLAAGFDKDAQVWRELLSLGFGFVEVGTLTPLPQPGNPRPRLFRLPADEAVINRMGFNNGGLAAALPRLRRDGRGLVGANVGANKESADRIADYAAGVRAAAAVADYVTVNISSPNTPGLRDLQYGAALRDLLAAAVAERGATPLFLKVAPDLDPAQVDDIARAAVDARVDALIVANTTVARPALRSPHADEAGGLSGKPLAPLALVRLQDFRRATGGALPLIAVGGLDSGAAAYARIRAGASLVQLYTALVFHGPGLALRIARDLAVLLRRDGFTSVGEAVGAG